MSRDIEQRVVQMEFENESFEKKASQSTKTLEKLDEKLQFKNGRKSFDDVQKAAEETNFKSFITAADTVTSKLSNLGIVGVTALQNITNKAVDAGTKLVKSLSIDQITAGWNKMDEITKSTGTLISQGYDMSEVEAQLDRLNWFTDETSYNLTDMVSNISKFTATGKDLKDSTTAMEGIALWAALSGQNASTASRAMYQLAQALGAGYMRLEDYKSIQNASMDTDEFRQKTIEAAIALGTLQDNLDGTYTAIETGTTFTKSNFAQSLTEGAWFTSDVMMKVFNDYSAAVDQIYDYANEKGITASEAIEELGGSVDEFGMKAFRAGQEARTFGDAIDSVKDAVSTKWANIFKVIFGNYDQQRKLWTNLSEDLYTLFAEPLDNKLMLLQETFSAKNNDLSGSEAFMEGLSNILGALIDRVELFREVLGNIFPAPSAEQLRSLIDRFNELTQKLALTEDRAGKLSNIFSGMLTPIKFILGLLKESIGALTPLTKLISYVGNDIISLLSLIGSSLSSVFSGEGYKSVFEFVRNVIDTTVDTIISLANLVKRFGTYVSSFIPKVNILESISGIFDSLGISISGGFKKASDSVKNFNSFIDSIGEKDFSEIFATIKSVAESFGNALERCWKKIEKFLSPIGKLFKSAFGKISPYLDKIKTGFQSFGSFIKTYVLEPIINFISEITKSGTPFKTFLNGFKKIGNYAKTVGTNFKKLFSNIDFSKWKETSGDAIESIKKLLNEFVDFIKGEKENLSLSDILSVAAAATMIVTIQKISDAFKKIGGMADSVKTTFSSINAVFKAKQLSNFTNNFKALAGSILMIAGALAILTLVDTDKLKSAATALGILTAVMVGLTTAVGLVTKKSLTETDVIAMELLSKYLLRLARAMILMSAAVLIIGKSNAIDETGWNKTAQTIGLIIVMAGVLAGLSFALSSVKGKITAGALSMAGLAAAFFVMSLSIEKLSKAVENANISGETMKTIGIFVGIIVAISSVAAVFGAIFKKTGSLNQTVNIYKSPWVLNIVGIILSIKLILETLKELKTFSIKGLSKKVSEIIVVVGIVATLMAVIGIISKYTNLDRSIAIMGVGLLAAVGAMYLIVLMIERLVQAAESINFNSAINAITMVGSIVAILILALGAASKLSGGSRNFISITIALLAVVSIMAIVAVMLKVFKDVSLPELQNVGTMFGMIAVVLAGLMLAIGWAAKLGGAKGIVYVIGIISMIVVLTFSIMALTRFTWDQLKGPMAVIGITLISLCALFVFIGMCIKLATENVDKAKLGTLIGMILLIGVLGASLVIISKNNWKQVAAACAGMAIVFLALAGAVAILDKVQANAKTIISLLAIAVALSGIMIAFAFAMSLLPLDQVESFHEAVLQMLLAVGVLMAAMLILGAVAGFVPTIGVGMIVMAGVLVIIAAAVIIFAKAINILDGCDLEKIGSNLVIIGNGLGTVGAASALMIVAALASLALSVAFLALGGSAKVCANGLNVLTPAITAFLNILSAIASAYDSNSPILGTLRNLREELQNSSETANETAQEVGEVMPTRMAVGIQSKEGEVTGTVQKLNESVDETLEEGKASIAETAKDYGSTITDSMTESIENFDGSKITSFIQENLLSGLSVDGIKESFGDLDLSSLLSGLGEQVGSAKEGISVNLNGALSGIDLTSGLTGLSTNLTSGLSNALNGVDVSALQPILVSKFQTIDWNSVMMLGIDPSVLSSAMTNQFSSASNMVDVAVSGEKLGGKFIDAIAVKLGASDSLYKIRSSGKTVTNEANSGAQSVDTTTSGAYIVEGILKGINDNAWKVRQAASSLATSAANAINNVLKINSPSRVTENSGMYFDLGLERGIIRNGRGVYKSAEIVAIRTLSALNKTLGNSDPAESAIVPVLDMSTIYSQIDAIGDEAEWQPVIKPVLDLSEVNPSLKNLKAIVGTRAETEQAQMNQNGSIGSSQNTWSPTFNQYNYSPKSLSRAEIYRQTKNQFSALKGVMQ